MIEKLHEMLDDAPNEKIRNAIVSDTTKNAVYLAVKFFFSYHADFLQKRGLVLVKLIYKPVDRFCTL